MNVYTYSGGEWEARDPMFGEYSFELWNGCHEDTVTMYGYDENDQWVRLEVSKRNTDIDGPIADQIKNTTRYSAANKWGYSHAVIYGRPRTPHQPHVVVLEIAEDGYEGIYENLSPYPYLVYVHLAFTTHLILVDSFADLAKLLGEVLPLVGNPVSAPATVEMLDLHKWDATYGQVPLRTR